jgi:hypothetical protein
MKRCLQEIVFSFYNIFALQKCFIKYLLTFLGESIVAVSED